MAEITAALVKELREMTSAGMMDCKKALSETDGDIEKAVDLLREKGLGKAAKKADRLASEGLVNVCVEPDFKVATVSEINAETDFVAKNEGFINLTKDATLHIQASGVQDVQELMKTTINGTVFEEYFASKVATIGENLVVRRFATIKAGTNGVVNGYVHSNGRVGVIIAASCDSEKTAQASADFIRNLCMHAAAMKPSFLSYSGLDLDFVEKENIAIKADIEKENEELRRLKKPLKRIPLYVSKLQLTPAVMEQAKKDMEEELKAQGKPEKIWDKIIPGQLERFIADNTQLDQQLALLSQFYVMDDKKTVEQVVEEKAKELGGKIELVEYVRFELGEGLEKRGCDFASEVADQLK
ncbi:MAG: translation elongation factor Ts [Sulfurospirillaceae bacterium]|nr:translation elongation factor Ts [Sulfurospirillaceae bacterium]MDD3463423.1 translation elongation factor Ts [Sulfurospirillaceae bacterium]